MRLILTLFLLTLPLAALAQEPPKAGLVDILPAKAMEEKGLSTHESAHTHPPVRLTPDKSEIITLNKPAASIIVGNPLHLSILADSSKRLVLVPRAPGASYFTILDNKGNVIMQRHAIVASPKKQYVRVRRACASSGNENCQQTSVFYCPDMCHQIMIEANANDDTGDIGAEGTAASEAPSENATAPQGENESE